MGEEFIKMLITFICVGLNCYCTVLAILKGNISIFLKVVAVLTMGHSQLTTSAAKIWEGQLQ